MKRSVLLLSVFLCIADLAAQNEIRISRPELSFSDNVLTVKYDITGCGSGEFVDITLIVLNSKGDTIKPGYITGDMGFRVTCGTGKVISWNIGRDNAKIDDDIQVLVKGRRSAQPVSTLNMPESENISRGKILVSSVFVPGLGLKKASGKSGFLVFSGLAYGGLGAALFLNLQSKKLKDDYLAATGNDRDNKFSKWEKNYNMTRSIIYGTAGVWAVNLIWSAVIPIKENPGKRLDFSLKSFNENELLISARLTF